MKELNDIIERYKKKLYDYQKGYSKPDFYLNKTGEFQNENKLKCDKDNGLILCYTCGGKRLLRKRDVRKAPEKCPTCNGFGFLVSDWVASILYPGAKMMKKRKKEK